MPPKKGDTPFQAHHVDEFGLRIRERAVGNMFSLDGPEWVVKPQCVSSCSLFLREAGRYSARLLRLCAIIVFIQ
jgi:hypothetical protein